MLANMARGFQNSETAESSAKLTILSDERLGALSVPVAQFNEKARQQLKLLDEIVESIINFLDKVRLETSKADDSLSVSAIRFSDK